METLADIATLYVTEAARNDGEQITGARLVSLEFCEALLEHAGPIYVARQDGSLIYANTDYWEITELLGVDNAGRTRLPDHHLRMLEDVARSGQLRVLRERADVAGRMRHFSARHFAVRDRGGELLAVAGTFADTTRETEALAAAGRERHRFIDVMRAASDWIWETDENGLVTFVSDRITDATGMPPIMIKGRELFNIGRLPATEHGPNKAVGAVAEHRPFREALFEIPTSDKNTRTFHLSGVPIFDTDGAFRGYRGAGSDVTARIDAEDQALTSKRALESTMQELINKNAQLEVIAKEAMAANHAKEEFLATMSHELRTPLNAIIGFADLIAMQPFGEVGAKYLDYVDEVGSAGRHLLSIITDCLEVARMEMDSLPLNLAEVPLGEIIREAAAMVVLRAEEKQIDLTPAETDTDLIVRVDKTRCFQIFVNLFGNGVKFTPEKGQIGVDIKPAEDSQSIDIIVWDTGPGIPPEARDLIFEKFQQLHDNIFSRANEGVGLGLTLSRQFARLMGGDVQLDDQVETGCRFRVTLPLCAGVSDADRA